MRLLSIILFLAFVSRIYSQNLENMEFELLDEEDGLSSHNIYDIALDSTGFYWISTADGLNRYDGHSFKVYKHDPNDTTSILENNANTLYVDFRGRLWLGYLKGGMSYFEKSCQCFKHFKANDHNLKIFKKLTQIRYVDHKDRVWFTANDEGLVIFDPKTKNIEQYDLPFIDSTYSEHRRGTVNTVMAVLKENDEIYWLATNNGLYKFDDKTNELSYKKYINPTTNDDDRQDHFLSITAEKDKGFWLSSWNAGISYFNKKTEKFDTYLPFSKKKLNYTNVTYDIKQKSENELWVLSGSKGLIIFHKDEKRFEFKKDVSIDKKRNIELTSRMIISNNKNFLISELKGLLKYSSKSDLFDFNFLPINSSQNVQYFYINSILEDKDINAIYFGTFLGNGFNILDTKTGKIRALKIDVNPRRDNEELNVRDIVKSNNGNVWVLTRDYVYKLDKVRKELINLANTNLKKYTLPLTYYRKFIKNKNGEIFIIADNDKILQLNPENNFIVKDINKNGNSKTKLGGIQWIVSDSKNNFWVVQNDTLACYKYPNYECIIIKNSEMKSLLKRGINAMRIDTFDKLWCGTANNGLFIISKSSAGNYEIDSLNTSNNFPSNNIIQLFGDKNGYVWVATSNEVTCLNAKTFELITFNQTVGMTKNLYQMVFTNKNKDELYITDFGSYAKVDYSNINTAIQVNKVYIDNIKVGNRIVNLDFDNNPTLTLKPSENFITLTYGSINHDNQNFNKFRYKLEGYDVDWVDADKGRSVNYTNLEGGNYTFNVMVSNIDGKWSEPATLSFYVKTPYYKTKWFAILIVLLSSTLIYLFYRYRINEIEKTEKLKTEFNKQITETRIEALQAQMNPHFIFNCLNSINRYIIKNDVKTSSLYLTKFAKLIRLILDNSKHKKILLSNEIEALKLYIEMEVFRFEKKFSYELIVDDEVETESIEVPPLIIQPYIENAIWHGLLHKEGDGHLKIRFSQTSEFLLIEIMDNGIGRKKAEEFKSENTATRKSHGLKLTEERLQYFTNNETINNKPEIIDLYDEHGNAVGTKVLIKIFLQHDND